MEPSSSLDFWRAFGDWGFRFVILGVAGEVLAAVIEKYFKAHFDKWKSRWKLFEILSGAVLVFGLAMEYHGTKEKRKSWIPKMRNYTSERATVAKEAAQLRKEAEEARLARVAMEKQIAEANSAAQGAAEVAGQSEAKLQDRRITPPQREIILMELKSIGQLAEVHFSSGDPEIAQYARDIVELLNAAGFNVQTKTALRYSLAGVPEAGLSITVDPKQLPTNGGLMQSVLKKAGVKVVWFGTEGVGNKFLIHIGRKV